jgi:AcrR family transcriptional regulator
MNKNSEISERTRQTIIDAFWEIYCNKRIEKITVKEITTKAGYNRSTFYEYFIDVYDVLEQIEQSLLPTIEDMPPLLPILSESPIPINSFIKLYSSGSKYYTVLLGDNGDPAFAAKMKNSIKSKLMEHFGENATSVIELDYILEYMLSAMIAILTHYFKCGENIPKEELIKLISDLTRGDVMRRFTLPTISKPII